MTKNLEVASSPPKRIPELDGLRGLAILLVISFHYINNQLTQSTNKMGIILNKATSFGWVGVDLFFVLSGFLIGSILVRNKQSKNYFSSFFIRRLVRIVPNYYLLIIIFMIILSMPLFLGNYFLSGNNVLPIWSYFTMVHNFYMARLNNLGTDAMSVTWSIGIEEQFYIIFPFIVYYVKDKWLPIVLIAAIITACILRMSYKSWIPAYVLLPCRMDAISIGALVAWLNYHYNLKEFADKYLKILIAVVVLDAITCGFLFAKYNDLGPIKNSLFAIVFAILLVFALTYNNNLYGKFLRNKLLIWIGTISYSLYLFHYLILGAFHQLINKKEGLGINNSTDVIISVLAFAFSLVFSWIVYKWLESPMVNWGKRFKY